MRERDGILSILEEPVAAEALGINRETPVNCLKGIRTSFSKKGMWPIVQLKCLYTSASKVGNKEEQLVATAQMKNYDLIAITET